MNTVPQSLKSVSQDAQRTRWCLSLLKSRSGDINQSPWSNVRRPGRASCVKRSDRERKRSRNRGESARTIPGEEQGYRHCAACSMIHGISWQAVSSLLPSDRWHHIDCTASPSSTHRWIFLYSLHGLHLLGKIFSILSHVEVSFVHLSD